MTKAPLTLNLDIRIHEELKKRGGTRGASGLADDILMANLFGGPTDPADAAKTQDLEERRAKCIEQFRATSKSDEKAESLIRTAIKEGLFSNRTEFIEAFKKANGGA